MCAPALVAGAAFTAASAGASIYAQKKQGDFDAQVAQNNAGLALNQAHDARRAGAAQSSRIKAEGSNIVGQAQAALAKGNISSTSGSGAGIIETTRANAAADAETARANAARAAWGFQNEAQDLTAQAAMRKRAGILGGVSTGLSAAGGLIGKFGS